MTAAERKNAAVLLQYTTVRPFRFMGNCFKCFYCLKYYDEIPSLLEHTSAHEIEDRSTILDKYAPKTKRTLQVDISNLECRICGEKYRDLNSTKEHLQEEHKKQLSAGTNGMTEYNMQAVNGILRCHICDEGFHTFSLLNSHMNCHVGKVVCEYCGAGFLDQHLLIAHKESHQIKKFCCKQCDRVFFKKSQLKYHVRIIHKGKESYKPRKCPHCPETCKQHYSLMVHLKEVHGISKTFECHVCKSTFSMRKALTEHTYKFHTEKYKCEICSKCFGMRFRLKQHMKMHTGEKTFICPICSNAFMYKLSLRKHIMRSHSTFTD